MCGVPQRYCLGFLTKGPLLPDVIEIVGAVIAGLLGRELWEWGRRKFFPKSPEIEFRGWLLNYNRAAQTLLVKVQAVVPSSPSHIAYAGCNVEIGGAVHVTELERRRKACYSNQMYSSSISLVGNQGFNSTQMHHRRLGR